MPSAHHGLLLPLSKDLLNFAKQVQTLSQGIAPLKFSDFFAADYGCPWYHAKDVIFIS